MTIPTEELANLTRELVIQASVSSSKLLASAASLGKLIGNHPTVPKSTLSSPRCPVVIVRPSVRSTAACLAAPSGPLILNLGPVLNATREWNGIPDRYDSFRINDSLPRNIIAVKVLTCASCWQVFQADSNLAEIRMSLDIDLNYTALLRSLTEDILLQ